MALGTVICSAIFSPLQRCGGVSMPAAPGVEIAEPCHESRRAAGALEPALLGRGLSLRHRAERVPGEPARAPAPRPDRPRHRRWRRAQRCLACRAGTRRAVDRFLRQRLDEGTASRGFTRRELAHRAGRLFAWDWRGRSFDIIAAIFIQFATPEERAVLFADIKQSLAPGGHLILQGY